MTDVTDEGATDAGGSDEGVTEKMIGPYGQAAMDWLSAGFDTVIPLPFGRKDPPPPGYTGYAGVTTSGADVMTWAESAAGNGNIALRLGDGLYGLDVDAYCDKAGRESLIELTQACGPLPETWTVTSRDDGSGIRLFRAALPPGRRWKNKPGPGIESVHRGHRYAVTWPSIHPEGRMYRLRWTGDGRARDGVVAVYELAALPDPWVEELSEPGQPRTGDAASDIDTQATINEWRSGEPCPITTAALDRAIAAMREGVAKGGLHDRATDSSFEIVCLGHEGHAGVAKVLASHWNVFRELRKGHDSKGETVDNAEWWRMVRGAVGKLDGPAADECDCALLAGEGVTFEAAELIGGEAEEGSVSAPIDPADYMTGEILSMDETVNREQPTTLIKGLLYLDTLAWLIGKPGSFKSFVALDIAAHVALGRPWAGRPVKQGYALYIVAEGLGGMTLRARAWRKVKGTVPAHALGFYPRAVQVRNQSHWSALVEATRRLRPALIVLDTQARVSVGIKENDNSDMGEFITQVDRLRQASGACVLVIHHIGRSGNDARGASAIDGAQDTELKVERIGGDKSRTARLVVDKQKDGPDAESVAFEMSPVDLGEDEDGDPVTSLVVNTNTFVEAATADDWVQDLPEWQRMIVEVMTRADAVGHTRAKNWELIKERYPKRLEKNKKPKSSHDAAWNSLIKKEEIGKVGGSERFMVIRQLPEG